MKFYGKEYAAKMAAANAAGNAWKRQEAAEGAANLARDRGDLAEYVRLGAISDTLRVAALAASEAARVAADDFVYARSRAVLAEVRARQGARRPCPVCQATDYEPEYDGPMPCDYCAGQGTLPAECAP